MTLIRNLWDITETYTFKHYKRITVVLCLVAIAVWVTFFIAWGISIIQ